MKYLILIIYLFIPFILNSSELNDIIKLDNDIILIRFNERVNYNSKLSEDKKNLFITIKNASNKSNIINKKVKTDLLKEIFIKSDKNNLLLNIIFNSSSGYNIYQLPYSNSIIIDVFDWSKINDKEDKYRSGLFAYESSLYSQSIKLFNESKFDFIEAQSLLGIVYLLEDSLHLSYPNLLQAARKESSIPDVYAALSQIYREKGNNTKANYYENKFFSKLSITDSSYDYPKLLFDKSKLESLDTEEIIDSSDVLIDSQIENDRFSHLFDSSGAKETSNDNLKKELENEDAFLNLKDFFIYILIVLLLLCLFIISIYLKWRKKRIDSSNQKAKMDFESELQNIVKKETKDSSIIIDRTDDENTNNLLNNSTYKPVIKGDITTNKNINISDTDLKIASKKILKEINLNSTASNLNIESNKLDNNKLKNQLYSKFNVHNTNNK